MGRVRVFVCSLKLQRSSCCCCAVCHHQHQHLFPLHFPKFACPTATTWCPTTCVHGRGSLAPPRGSVGLIISQTTVDAAAAAAAAMELRALELDYNASAAAVLSYLTEERILLNNAD